MEDLQIFNNPEFGSIRATVIDDEPWFVGKDVAMKLGYENPQKAIRDHVDYEDLKMGERNVTPSITDSLGREQYPSFINESGLYSLILSSKMVDAKRFKHWVTSEVIPSIRKHGAYMTEQTLEKALTSPDFLIKLATQLKEEQEKNRKLTNDNQRMRPKEIFADAVATSKTSILIGDLAKLITQNGYSIGQKRLFEWMRANGFLMCNGSSKNMPTQRYVEQGLFEVKESTINNPDGSVRITKTTKVTGKGQVYFVNKFLAG